MTLVNNDRAEVLPYQRCFGSLDALFLQQTQTPERRPAQHGVLDSRLVRPSQACICLMTLQYWPLQCIHRGAAYLPALIVELGLQGVSNKASTCQTCGQKLADCTGHFGVSIFILDLESR